MQARFSRCVAISATLCLVIAGCESSTVETTHATATTLNATNTTVTGLGAGASERQSVYRIGLTEPFSTDNPWAIHDTEAQVWNFLVNPSDPSLYTWVGPVHTFIPSLAADAEWAEPVAEGDVWSVIVPLRGDVWWSDGEPVDAHDVAFTFDTVKRLALAGGFFNLWPVASVDDPDTEQNEYNGGLVSVEAVDASTVKLVFNIEPGIAMWPFNVGSGPIFPEHYWGPIVADIDAAEDLYLVSGVGAPHTGGFVISDWQASAFWANTAEDDFYDRGAHYVFYSNGVVEYTNRSGDSHVYAGEPDGEVLADFEVGPFVSEIQYSIYSDKSAAMLALEKGDIDYLWSPVGLERGLAETAMAHPDLEVAVNPQNGFRYLAFNLRRFPMSEQEFRYAVACRIDKEFMADTVLAGAAIALDTMVPPGYPAWFNEEATAPCSGLSERERFEEAVRVLDQAGWTWDVTPAWDEDAGDISPRGSGLRGPEGSLVPELELLSPGSGYDAMRATYALFIEEWVSELGVAVTAETTSFGAVVNAAFSPEANFDMYILGWGVTPFPSHVFDVFVSDADSVKGGFNTPGYSSPAFDALAREWNQTRSLDRARELIREAEEVLIEDLPYVVLFAAPAVDVYRRDIEFPFTSTIGGVTWHVGFPTSVHRR